jgi:hypothetical protein
MRTNRVFDADGIFAPVQCLQCSAVDLKIDQSIAIVVETEKNLDRVNSSLKSKVKKIDGLGVGIAQLEEEIFADNSVLYED